MLHHTVKKGLKSYSMVKRMALGLSVIFLFLLIILLLNNLYTFHILRRNAVNQLSDSLKSGNKQITSDLNNVSTYLATLSQNAPDITILEQNKRDSNFYSALYNTQNSLTAGLSSMSAVDGLFVFSPECDEFIYETRSQTSYQITSGLREWCRAGVSDGTLDFHVSKYWFSFDAGKSCYLVKLLKTGSSYVGAWTKFSTLLSLIDTPDSLDASLYFAYNDQCTYNASSRQTELLLYPEDPSDRSQYVFWDDTNYLAVSLPASYTESGYLYLLTSYSHIALNLARSYVLSILSIAFFLLLALVAFGLFRYYLSRPIEQLESSLVALRDGDFSIRLPEHADSVEFNDVNLAFNQMIQRIEDLKIDVYEKKLSQQKTELLALKNQIAPHFLINCLNSIYHMSVAGNLDGIQHMTVYLGEHLRYALSDVTYVPLEVELEKVRNYVELSKIRFPDCIELFVDLPETMKDAMVPPMILLFQVENIIKYEVVYGELTEIHIEIRNESSDLVRMRYPDFSPQMAVPARYLHFTTWDTGTGYSAQVLRQLRSPEQMNQSDGHNIGTRNTFKRLDLLFDGQFYMDFSNREHAGAQVDILIPYQKTEEKERTMV